MSVPPCRAAKLPASDYVIFGGTGDLALRKIFPAFSCGILMVSY